MTINDKLDKISEDVATIKVTLAAQHVSLQDHMSRSTQLEARMKPLEESLLKQNWTFKLIGIVFGAAATIASILEVVIHF